MIKGKKEVNSSSSAGKSSNSNKKVTLSIDSKTYEAFQKYCEENAIMLSKKIELFMKKELDEDKDDKAGDTHG